MGSVEKGDGQTESASSRPFGWRPPILAQITFVLLVWSVLWVLTHGA